MQHKLLAVSIISSIFFLSCQPAVIEVQKVVTVERVRYVEIPKIVDVCGQVDRTIEKPSFMRTREQAVKLARWCVTEDACVLWPKGTGSSEHPDCGTDGHLSKDCKAIVEVAENNRKNSHKSWEETLAFIASTAMGDKEPKSQRQVWIKTLPEEGMSPPAAWRDCRDHEPCDGDWRLYGERWARLRENMVEYWLTGPHDACPGTPLAEGTMEDAEQIAIPKRGFVRYDCGERLWIGGPPDRVASTRTLTATVARGDF